MKFGIWWLWKEVTAIFNMINQMSVWTLDLIISFKYVPGGEIHVIGGSRVGNTSCQAPDQTDCSWHFIHQHYLQRNRESFIRSREHDPKKVTLKVKCDPKSVILRVWPKIVTLESVTLKVWPLKCDPVSVTLKRDPKSVIFKVWSLKCDSKVWP